MNKRSLKRERNAVIPVAEERLRVRRRRVETGKVVLHKRVAQREELVDQPILLEEIEVRRVKLDKRVERPQAIRQEGDTLIVPLHEEVLVVEKQLRVREEVHLRRTRRRISKSQRVQLRREEMEIQGASPGSTTQDA